MHNRKVLAVIDASKGRRELADAVAGAGCKVVARHSSSDAEAAIRGEVFDLVIADLGSPYVDSLSFVSYFRDKNPFGRVVMLAKRPDFSSALTAMRLSASDYLYDPVAPEMLVGAVEKALHEADSALGRLRTKAAEENHRLKEELERANLETIMALAGALEARDGYTRGHSFRVSELAVRIGRGLKLALHDIARLRYGGILHDIGKIGVDKAVLNKSGELSPGEFEDISRHAEIGVNIVSKVESLKGVLPIIRYHHEPYRHLKAVLPGRGPDFLLVSIVKAADAFDAMVSDRPYRRALPPEMALMELMEYSGTEFHPQVVAQVEKLMREDAVKALRGSDVAFIFGRGGITPGTAQA